MAEKRMLSKQIVESDAFLDMPLSSQALYMHLCMTADDDGVVNSPKRVQRYIGASEDDLKLLIAKRFIIPFESGIIIIKHWLINNTIKKDRYKPTLYQKEWSSLFIKETGAYTDHPLIESPLDDSERNQTGTNLEPNWNQIGSVDKTRLDKTSTEKTSIDKFSKGQTNSVRELLSEDEIKSLQQQLPPGCFEYLIGAIDTQGFSDIKKPYNYILQFAKNRGFIK